MATDEIPDVADQEEIEKLLRGWNLVDQLGVMSERLQAAADAVIESWEQQRPKEQRHDAG